MGEGKYERTLVWSTEFQPRAAEVWREAMAGCACISLPSRFARSARLMVGVHLGPNDFFFLMGLFILGRERRRAY